MWMGNVVVTVGQMERIVLVQGTFQETLKSHLKVTQQLPLGVAVLLKGASHSTDFLIHTSLQDISVCLRVPGVVGRG